jgi:hypothetical protein
MIIPTSIPDGPPVTFNVTVRGLAVYLDNWAMIDLAEGDPVRRKRFVDAVCAGGDLLFSVTNAAELSGPQGQSVEVMRTFLDELGPHWFPVELNPFEVVQREQALQREQPGGSPGASCICKRFVNDYFAEQFADCLPNSGKVIDLSHDTLSLGAVLDWVGPQRATIRQRGAEIDAALIKQISTHRAEFERGPAWLDEHFPVLPFNPYMPATFAYINLVRTLILEANTYPLKKNDGLDFCHAVMATAFSSVATLDTHWKRRVESLPPNKLARVYSSPDLNQMVTDIESCVNPGA